MKCSSSWPSITFGILRPLDAFGVHYEIVCIYIYGIYEIEQQLLPQRGMTFLSLYSKWSLHNTSDAWLIVGFQTCLLIGWGLCRADRSKYVPIVFVSQNISTSSWSRIPVTLPTDSADSFALGLLGTQPTAKASGLWGHSSQETCQCIHDTTFTKTHKNINASKCHSNYIR